MATEDGDGEEGTVASLASRNDLGARWLEVRSRLLPGLERRVNGRAAPSDGGHLAEYARHMCMRPRPTHPFSILPPLLSISVITHHILPPPSPGLRTGR